jgi:hypothetical protein
MLRHHRPVVGILVIVVGTCTAPRPSQGAEWSPEYQAGLKKTAERNSARKVRKKQVAMKHRAVERANTAMMQQLAMQEALRMEQVAMQQAMMMQQLAMQQAFVAQRQMLMRAEAMRPRTVFDTLAYINQMQTPNMMPVYVGVGGGTPAAPEIDAGPAAGAVALLVASVLMLADRRRARLA